MTGDPARAGGDGTTAPAGIDRDRHGRLRGRGHRIWYRRAGIAVLAALCAAGLLSVFGQQPRVSVARGPAAELRVEAPDRLRGGLVGEVVIDVTALRRIGDPRLVLAEGFIEGMTVNSTLPDPLAEEDAGGGLVLAYDPIGAGETLRVRIHFQVNPTRVGRGDQDVEVRDGNEVLAAVDRDVVVFP